MTLATVADRGLVLLGCGKMGTALLSGWLDAGLPAGSVWVLEPSPTDWLVGRGVHLNQGVPPAPAVALLAVKPQMMGAALPALRALGQGATLFVSIAAGTTIASFEAVLGAGTPIVRTMPNTPAMVGRGITAICGNAHVSQADLALTRALMAAAGEAEGLPPDIAMRLARATVSGAGELAHRSPDSAAQLRINVTSPGGTTAAALAVLMDRNAGFPALLRRAVRAAADRGRELGK